MASAGLRADTEQRGPSIDTLVPPAGRTLDWEGVVQLEADCVVFLRAWGFTPLPVVTRTPVEVVDVEHIDGRESTIGLAEVIRCYCPKMLYIGSQVGLAITEGGQVFAGLSPIRVPGLSETIIAEDEARRFAVSVRCDSAVTGLTPGSLALACNFGFRKGSKNRVDSLFGPQPAHLADGLLSHSTLPTPERMDQLIRNGLQRLLKYGLTATSPDVSDLLSPRLRR